MTTPRSRLARTLALALVVGAATACTQGQSGEAGITGRRQQDVITAEEIATTSATNMYQVVEALRPTFLRGRGPGLNAPATPVVYLNGQRWGDVESLRNIAASDVVSVRRMSAADAQTRYGMDNTGGVLDVVTKRGGTS